MARRHRRHHSPSKKMGLGRALGAGSFALSFLSQITEKDISTNATAFAGYDLGKKGAFLANTVIGRISGINLFSDMPQVRQTMNPGGALNKWTTTGLLVLLLNKVTRGLGAGSIVKDSVGKGFLTGGIIGGFFDDPAIPQNAYSSFTQQNFGRNVGNANGFSSGNL